MLNMIEQFFYSYHTSNVFSEVKNITYFKKTNKID